MGWLLSLYSIIINKSLYVINFLPLVLVVLYDLGVTIPTPIEPIQKLIEFFIE